MSKQPLLAAMVSLIVACSLAVSAVRADVADEKTKLTFSEPVEIPGRVLPAGSYWFVLVSGRNLVRIFSADWSVVYATIITAPSERTAPSGETILTLAERPYSEPQAILTWFYPGETIGHEFIYSKHEEKELSRDAHLEVVAKPFEASSYSGS